ncbi:gamma-glutamyltransferase, partial [Paraburkholderia sp. SIMBA_055]
YLSQRASEVSADEAPGATPVKPGLGDAVPEKAQTTHFSVVDKWGNAVSNTTTLDGEFGSGVVVDGAGFLLNDAMDDFVTKAGAAGQSGSTSATAATGGTPAAGAELNTVLAGRRSLSSMTPTILLKDNKLSLVIGTPGGPRIL